MPAGKGRKGERQSRSRRGKQTTSMVVPRNPLPSAPSIGTNECENYLDAAQLHELFLASCQPGVATHQAQLSKLYPAVYNPPGFPFYGGRFIIHTLTHHRSFPSGTPSSDLVYSTRPSAAAGAWHLGLSSYCYYLVALPKNVKKCYGFGDNFSEKISSVTTQHRGQALRPSGGTQGREQRSVRENAMIHRIFKEHGLLVVIDSNFSLV